MTKLTQPKKPSQPVDLTDHKNKLISRNNGRLYKREHSPSMLLARTEDQMSGNTRFWSKPEWRGNLYMCDALGEDGERCNTGVNMCAREYERCVEFRAQVITGGKPLIVWC